MSLIDLDAVRAAQTAREPFDHFVATRVLSAEAAAEIAADFPKLAGPGLYPAGEAGGGPAFRALIREIEGPALRSVYAEKFGVALDRRPMMVTGRARARATDGKIHVDSTVKFVTSLLYLNQGWQPDGGRLRFLRGPGDLDDYIAEVPPDAGTLVAFRRTDNSWHGHKPFAGERRYVMFNWMTGRAIAAWETARHRASAAVKRLFGAGRAAA
jgi:SM-20-related protein